MKTYKVTVETDDNVWTHVSKYSDIVVALSSEDDIKNKRRAIEALKSLAELMEKEVESGNYE